MNSPIPKKMSQPSEKPNGGASNKLAAGFLTSVISLWLICSKHATRTSKKIAPKKVMATISNKAINFRQRKNDKESKKGGEEDGGVWQRAILMGDKCEPLDFSGVIYYDGDGNRLSEIPMRSPRASPLPSYAYKAEKERSRLGW